MHESPGSKDRGFSFEATHDVKFATQIYYASRNFLSRDRMRRRARQEPGLC